MLTSLRLRHGLVGLATLAALIPIGAAADGGVDVPGTVDLVLSTAADTGSKAASCVIEEYLNRLVVEDEYGGKVTCPSVVTSIKTTLKAVDDLLLTSGSVDCTTTTTSCSSDATFGPALVTDQVTLTYLIDAYLKAGWTWGLQPAGCSASGNHLHCTITTVYPGVSTPVIVPRI
jgi:hypothetical protein